MDKIFEVVKLISDYGIGPVVQALFLCVILFVILRGNITFEYPRRPKKDQVNK